MNNVARFLIVSLMSGIFAMPARAQTTNPDVTRYTLAIRHNANDDAAWYNRGSVYYKLGKYDLAVNDYSQSIKINAANFKALTARGNTYFKLANYDSAVADYTTVLENEPDDKNDKNLYLLRGDAYRMLRRYTLSLSDYNDALGIDSTRDTLWHNIGIDYYRLSKNDSAVYAFSKALTLRPATPVYQVRFILALLANDSYSQAASAYADYTQKKMSGYIETPDYAYLKTYITAGTNYISNGDYKSAIALLQQSLNAYKPAAAGTDKTDDIDYANILVKTGLAYEKMDSLNTALTYYQKAQAVNANAQAVGSKISRIQYSLKRNTVPPSVKLLAPVPAQTRGMQVDNDINSTPTTRGIKIEADTNTDRTITVKGFALSPTGIIQVKVNGSVVSIKNTDTTGYFETLISDTCSTLEIQAWNKQNIAVDTLFRLVTKQRNSTASDDFVIPPISDNENFHAIFIACTNYNGKWPALDSTIAEAERLKQELIDEYNFKPENIVTLYNKTKQDILKGIYQKLDALGEEDNVLIFYGGHGYLDQQTNMAYWVPALANDRLDYISNSDITEALQNRQAKHILVMADACFSGALRGMADDYVPTKFEYRQPSRQLLTSGSAETVPGVSVFIPNILEFLRFNQARYYSAGNLYVDISKPVQNESGRTPVFRDFQNISNSGAGQFYFKKKIIDSVHIKTPEEIAQDKIKAENARLDYQRRKDLRDSLVDAGKVEKDKEHLVEAVNLFQKAVDVNPDPYNTYAKNMLDQVNKLVNLTPDEHYKLCVDSANFNEAKGDHSSALKWYNKALEIKPEKRDEIGPKRNELIDKLTFFDKMDALNKAYQYKDAIREYSKRIKASPDKEYYLGRAKTLEAEGANYYNDAIADLNSATAIDLGYLQAIMERAELQEKMNRKKEAIVDYKTYVSLQDDPLIYMRIYALHNSKEINSKDDAIADLNGAIKLNPRFTEAYFDRGLLYIDKGDFNKALDDFNTTLKLDPLPALYYFYRGTCYINLNKIEDAAWDFKTARLRLLDSVYLKKIATDADDINFLATESADKKLYDAAIIYVNRAILVNPVSALYRYQKGNYYFEQKSYQTAIKNYDSAVYFNNNYSEALYKRGLAYLNLGKYDTAALNFDKVLKLTPNDIAALEGDADAHFKLEDWPEAAKAYEQALKVIEDGKNGSVTDQVKARLNNNLGYSYYQQSMYDQSIQALKKAVRFDENYGLAYYNLGKSYEKSGDIDNAIEKIDKALTYDANNYMWNYSDAGVYRQKNNFAKAIDLYTKAIQNDSSQELESATYYRGYSYRQTGDYGDAAKDYLNALSNNQDTAFRSFNNELGDVYYNLANYDSAYLFYKKSFVKDSSDANAIAAYGLASALFMQKKADDAMPLFEKAFIAKTVPKNTVKADKNFGEFKNDKRFKDLYNKYY